MGIVLVVIVLAVGLSFYTVLKSSAEGLPGPKEERSHFSVSESEDFEVTCKDIDFSCVVASGGEHCMAYSGDEVPGYVYPGKDFNITFNIQPPEDGEYKMQFYASGNLEEGAVITDGRWEIKELEAIIDTKEVTIPADGKNFIFKAKSSSEPKDLCTGSSEGTVTIQISKADQQKWCTVTFPYKESIDTLPDFAATKVTRMGSGRFSGRISDVSVSSICGKKYTVDYQWVLDGEVNKTGTRSSVGSGGILTSGPKIGYDKWYDGYDHKMVLEANPKGAGHIDETDYSNNEDSVEIVGFSEANLTKMAPTAVLKNFNCKIDSPCSFDINDSILPSIAGVLGGNRDHYHIAYITVSKGSEVREIYNKTFYGGMTLPDTSPAIQVKSGPASDDWAKTTFGGDYRNIGNAKVGDSYVVTLTIYLRDGYGNNRRVDTTTAKMTVVK